MTPIKFSKIAFSILLVFSLVFQLGLVNVIQRNIAYAQTLSVTLSANPSSGPAPLQDVDLTATVSGTATGPITYRFDCTGDGTFEQVISNTNQTSVTAVDLCDYPNPGSYTAKVKVERSNLSFEGTTGILVQQGPSLSVTLSANPSSGFAPLNDVDLTATVSGTATGPITYRFDCTNDGSFEQVISNTSQTSVTAVDLCDYPNPGNFTAKVKVERNNLAFEGTVGIFVQQPTLSVTLSANPSSGPAPLQDVDLTATVSGTATGPITYQFDCTNDGSFEFTQTTSSNPFVAVDLCDYPNQGTFTARVQVTRQSLTAQATTTITVESPPTLNLVVIPSPASGHAPLNDVDITASVSGTATGSITYRFDCTNDGFYERTTTTSSTTYTALDLCSYSSPGIYTLRVKVERQNLMVEGMVSIVVDTPATLAVDFSANPSSGPAPLNDVDFTAFVSGSATGTITYRFDCTGDDNFERTITTNSTSQTVFDLCDYQNPGNYTAKVRVTRGGVEVEGNTVILVF